MPFLQGFQGKEATAKSHRHRSLNSEALKQSEGRLNSCEAALDPLQRGSKCVQLNHILIQKMSE